VVEEDAADGDGAQAVEPAQVEAGARAEFLVAPPVSTRVPVLVRVSGALRGRVGDRPARGAIGVGERGGGGFGAGDEASLDARWTGGLSQYAPHPPFAGVEPGRTASGCTMRP
jgi:hypothetical protein